MKKSCLIVVFTLTCLLGLAEGALAQDASRIVANVPFDFVAGGQALPAGTYTVSRISTKSQRSLAIRSFDNGAFLLPLVFDDVALNYARLDFEHVGDKYFLSKIDTPAGAYTLATPRAMTKVAQMKDQDTMSSSGTH